MLEAKPGTHQAADNTFMGIGGWGALMPNGMNRTGEKGAAGEGTLLIVSAEGAKKRPAPSSRTPSQ